MISSLSLQVVGRMLLVPPEQPVKFLTNSAVTVSPKELHALD